MSNINLNSLKTDYSSMFSSMTGGSGASNWLGDYASIKNGSYGRLMKAYYSEVGSSSSTGSTSKTAKSGKSAAEQIINDKIQRSMRKESEESKAYTKVKSTVSDLQSSMDKLSDASGSLFEQKLITTTDEDGVETTQFGYDKEAIYKAMSDYVNNYNAVLKAAGTVGNTSMDNRVASIANVTKANEKALNQLGITINADNTLSINKDNFMKADMSTAKNLFSKDNTYTTQVSASADMIRYTANYEQLRAATYTNDGTFDSAYNTGGSYSSTM